MKKQLTPRERFEAIPIEALVMGLYGFILLMAAIAIYVRPDNTVVRYWAVHGIQADAMVLAMVGSIFVMWLGYYLWRNLLSIGLAMIPYWVVLALLMKQLFESSTAPLIHGVNAGAVVLLCLVVLFMAIRIDGLNQALELTLEQQAESE